MLIRKFLTGAAFLLTMSTYAQTTQHRYKDMLFKDVTIDENINYANSSDKKAHLFDIYQPHDDNAKKRPLIIWMHGGGFRTGSKNDKGIKLWSKEFAQRGYVSAAINYTLSKKTIIFGISASELQKSSYYAIQDLKEAIAYFKLNADKYRIDTSKIILAGNSAGAIMALQTAYTNNVQLGEQVGLSKSDADLHSTEFTKVAAVVNFWGAIFDIHWLENAKTPIVSVYGSTDGIIDPDHKGTPMYGSIAIKRKADEQKIPNAIKSFEGYSHELQKHFNPIFSADKETQERWTQASQFAADFLYAQLFEEKTKTKAKTGTTLDYRTIGAPYETKTVKKKKETTATAAKPKTTVTPTTSTDTGGTSLDYRTMWQGTEPKTKKKNK
ncbi:alpha/beta hydrolase [Mucilaginibacter jinjuensis]|uniref:Alpha/beta hydrolase n=1 Tax=Mucilaginibacter jinjuensis TaxID=1176721 RepID=A0ABY7T8P4_9SPHI|nr:alpha/beta hydrolase [Mucilaginibacter jinjuensis]WCT12042.1 alpha/beta hydrolase [Mucilaginibacter jinjuensis]